jgi:hypothetical protein
LSIEDSSDARIDDDVSSAAGEGVDDDDEHDAPIYLFYHLYDYLRRVVGCVSI